MRLAFRTAIASGQKKFAYCFDSKVRPQSVPKEEIMHSFPLNQEISFKL